MSTIRSPFSSRIITFNFSLVLIVFRQCLSGIVLGDEDLHFPLILGEKTPIILNREIHQPCNYITNVNNAHK